MAAALAKEPQKFGRYVLLGHIADGGMASVYLAQLRGEHRFAKWVALKVVHERHANDARFERMFLTEARFAGRIQHPSVAQVFDFGKVNGTCYLAMEYMSGETLHAAMKRAGAQHDPIPLTLAARIISNTAMALHAAHELHDDTGKPAGILHRDVSPQNIFLLFSGQTKLMDFGIAKSLAPDENDDLTEVGELKGKFAYMSPEQLTLKEVDRRSDVFSLGVVLWELACGVRLFHRRSEAETAVAVIHDPIPRPSTMRAGFPAELERIVMKALERDVEDRYATAAELTTDLEEFIASSGKVAGAPQAARWLEELFPDGKEEHSTTLRHASELLARNEHLISGEVDVSGEHVAASGAYLVGTLPRREPSDDESEPTSDVLPAQMSPRRHRGSAFALIAICALIGAGAAAWMLWPSAAIAPSTEAPSTEAPSTEAMPADAIAAPPPEPLAEASREAGSSSGAEEADPPRAPVAPAAEASDTEDSAAEETVAEVSAAPETTDEPAARPDRRDDRSFRARAWRRSHARPAPTEAAPEPRAPSPPPRQGLSPMTEFE